MRTRLLIDDTSLNEVGAFGGSRLFAANSSIIRLTDGDDRYRGGDDRDDVLCLLGNDIVWGEGGDDNINGAQGDDVLYGMGGKDVLSGGAGRDVLYGGGGDDTLYGDASSDVLCGGRGADHISLGRGRDGNLFDGRGDTVLYTDVAESTAKSLDSISNFLSGQDKVDFRLIDADVSTPGDDAFHFIRGAAFSGTAGELRFGDEGPSHIFLLQGDVDGDGQADFVVQFSLFGVGNDTLHVRDFML